jgi:hypothetical protein
VVLIVLFGYVLLAGWFAANVGYMEGPALLLALVPVVLFLLRRLGNQEADDFILSLPFIGPFYRRFFHPFTYYRIDTSEMFQQAVRAAVMEVIDQVTAAKGIRALTELERKPVMREFARA